MASYPTAVKSFTTKANGNTIQPAHINDLQDEVNAIEAGLLNGTANLNSSNSTVANLTVTGGSTFAGTLQVSGNSTFGGTLQVNGNSTFAGNVTITGTLTANMSRPFVRLTHSAKQDVANATWTGLSFDTETVDGSNLHSTAVNSSRINLTSSGSWLIGGCVSFNANSSGQRFVRILLNDTTTILTMSQLAVSGGLVTALAPITQAYVTSTSQYVTLLVYGDPGSTVSVTADGGANPCNFWAQQVG